MFDVSDTGTHQASRASQVVYDERQQFPETITNSLNQVTSAKYDPSIGLPITVAANEKVVQNSYDGFGRVLMTAGPSGVVTRRYAPGRSAVNANLRTVQVLDVSDSSGRAQTTYLDAFGRPVLSTWKGLQGKEVFVERVYGQDGLLSSESRPHLDGDNTQGGAQFFYDNRRRLVSKLLNGVPEKHGYASAVNCAAATCPDGLSEVALTSVTSPRDSSLRFSVLNQRGNVTRVRQGAATSTYRYGLFNKLIRVTDPDSNDTILQYDSLSRMHHIEDPDRGARTYEYNAFGEIQSVTDASQRVREFAYDTLGRLTQITDSIDGPTRFCFDSACDQPAQRNEAGNLVERISPDGVRTRTEFEADAVDSPAAIAAGLFGTVNRGFPIATHQTVPASLTGQATDEELAIGYKYNDQNLLSQVDYPESLGESFGVGYHYDVAGNLDKLFDVNGSPSDARATFWHLTSVYQGLRPATETTGDRTTTTRNYDSLFGYLNGLKTVTPQANGNQTLQHVTFDHYKDGLLLSATDDTDGSVTGYGYDSSDRLLTETTQAGSWFAIKRWAYSDSGNVQKQASDVYSYDDPAGPHRVTNARDIDYQYQDNGDIWKRSGAGAVGGTQTFEHTGFHLPKRVLLGDASAGPQEEVDFAYDADQQRVWKHSGLGDRLYFDGYERFQPSATGPRAFPGEEREHVYKVHAPGGLLVQIVRGEQAGTITDQAVLYVHGDRQGSPAIIRDQDGGDHGSPTWSSIGTPLGNVSWESSDSLARSVRTTYTAHEFDEELGLTNMGGRIYDQNVGRFMQPDPVLVGLFNTQGLNGYSYVFNLPTGFTDPTGLWGDADDDDDDDEAPPPTKQYVPPPEGADGYPNTTYPPENTYPAMTEILVCGSNRPPGCESWQPRSSNGVPPVSSNGDFSPGQPQVLAASLDTGIGPRIAPPRPGLPPGLEPPPPSQPTGEVPTGGTTGEAPTGEVRVPGVAGLRLLGWVPLIMSVPGDSRQPQFLPFTRNNFRHNLNELTGYGGHRDKDAHHVFPQKFVRQFRAIGINVHDPRYGAWWDRDDHLDQASGYNDLWEEFFLDGTRTAEDAKAFARALAETYGYSVNF